MNDHEFIKKGVAFSVHFNNFLLYIITATAVSFEVHGIIQPSSGILLK